METFKGRFCRVRKYPIGKNTNGQSTNIFCLSFVIPCNFHLITRARFELSFQSQWLRSLCQYLKTHGQTLAGSGILSDPNSSVLIESSSSFPDFLCVSQKNSVSCQPDMCITRDLKDKQELKQYKFQRNTHVNQ